MKRIIALILCLIVTVSLCACGTSQSPSIGAVEQEAQDGGHRFDVVEYNENSPVWQVIYVITDLETGEQYLFFRSGEAGGLCHLEIGD